MESRKSKRDKRGRLRKRKARKFPKAALARNLRAQTTTDELTIRIRYAARHLLSVSQADIAMIEDDALGC